MPPRSKLAGGLCPGRGKADGRQVLYSILEGGPTLAAGRPGQILIGDKNHYGKGFETALGPPLRGRDGVDR